MLLTVFSNMAIKPGNTKPFWALFILLILDLAWRTALIITVVKLRPLGGQVNFIPIIVQMTVTFIVLLSEAIVYWKLRRRFEKMSWVWAHIFLLYFILILMPIVYLFVLPLLTNYFNPQRSSSLIINLSVTRVILFWSSVAIAHIFFVLTIVKSKWKNKSTVAANDEPANLLDEFNG